MDSGATLAAVLVCVGPHGKTQKHLKPLLLVLLLLPLLFLPLLLLPLLLLQLFLLCV